jgi:FkbM family methyltransferase
LYTIPMLHRLPRSLRRMIRRLRDLPVRWRERSTLRRTLGPVAARQLGWSAFAWPIGDPSDGPGPMDSIVLPGLLHPFWYRHGTSDVLVIKQIFVQLEYRRLQGLPDIHTIFDVGANIGAAAVMLLTIFPKARLIAVEPEPGNLAVLRRNLEPYGERAFILEAAVWPTATPLEVVKHTFRDGLDWSNQVKPAVSSTEVVCGMTIEQMMADAKVSRIDLLKMDVEGAELPVLQGDTAWLGKVKHLCIELHGEEHAKALDQALVKYEHTRVSEGETLYCHDIR